MIIPLLVGLLGAGFALLRGGSLDRLAATRWRWVPLLFAGLAVQIGFLLWNPPWMTEAARLAVTLGSMVTVAFFLTINQHLAGTLIAALGLSLNVLVIGVNGAMPVSPEAARMAGAEIDDLEQGGLKHELMTDETLLRWLGDVIPIPRWGVVSIGDAILGLGLGRLTYVQTLRGGPDGAPGRRRRTGSKRPGDRSGGSAPGAPPAPPPSPRRPG